MNTDGGEPIISDKVSPLSAVRYVPFCIGLDIPLGEAEVDHVDCVLIFAKSDHTIAKLNIPVKHFASMHGF
jgi:hypothetical protein